MTIQRIKVDIPDERPYEVHLGSFASTWIGDDLIELGVKPHIMVSPIPMLRSNIFQHYRGLLNHLALLLML